ncbi:MAG: hypothetical protein AB7V40_04480 [Methyloceanibacter sp.]
MTIRNLKRATLVLAAASVWLWASQPADAAGNPFEQLSGDWTGEGTVKLKDGRVKTVSCKVNYKVAGSNLTQSLACTGDDYEIEATLKLADKDGRVKGQWTEVIYDASGEVVGKAHDDAIRAVIRGDKFSGRMSLKVTDAGHTINMLQLNEDTGTYRLATSLTMHR